jgi:glutamyl-tRNA reductase
MSLLVVGVSHRTAPLAILERTSIPSADLEKALHQLSLKPHISETVVLATCNRTECYVQATRFHDAVDEVTDFLCEWSELDRETLSEHLYTYHDDTAAQHLFQVAAGTLSIVLGETEILGQVRNAALRAQEAGAARHQLGRLFRHAQEVGRRARSETKIGEGFASLSSVAVALAAETLGKLSDKTVVLLGAGEIGMRMATAMAASGVHDVVVVNRSPRAAADLATQVGGRHRPIEDLPDALHAADVLLTSTGADHVMLDRDDLEMIMSRRPGRPLLIIDLAMPRDVAPDAGRVPGVTRMDMEDCKTFVESSLDQRRIEASRVLEIVDEEVERARNERAHREVAPLIAELRRRVEQVRVDELARYKSRIDAVDPEAQELIEAVTKSLVNKLLHQPTMALKMSAYQSDGPLTTDLVARLYEL